MLTLAAAFLLGFGACRLLHPKGGSAGLALAVGLAAQILAGAVAALLKLGSIAALGIFLIMAVGIGAWGLTKPRRSVTPGLRMFSPKTRRMNLAVELVLVAACLYAVHTLWLLTGVPPAMFDVLSYHLPIAQAFAADDFGRAAFWSPTTFYERLPLGASMIEATYVGAPAGGPFGPALHAFLLLCTMMAATSAARCAALLGARPGARWGAALLYLCHPMIMDTQLKLLVEPIIGLVATAALELLLASRRRPAMMGLAGFLAASCAAMKLSAVGVVCAPLLFVAGVRAFALRGDGPRRWSWLLPVGLYGIGMALAMGPWLLRGVLISGSPMHPFGGFSDVWRQSQAEFVVRVHGPLTLLGGDWWSALVAKRLSLGYGVAGVPLLLLAGLAGLALPRTRCAAVIALASLAGYAAWIGVRDNPERFLLPAALWLTVAAAVVIARLMPPRIPRYVAPLVMLAIAIFALRPNRQLASSFDPVYTVPDREMMLGSYVGTSLRQMALVASDQAGSGAVLLFFEARPTLFHGRVVSHTVWDQPPWAQDLKDSTDDTDFARRLRARGIEAIFVNEPEWARYLQFYGDKARLPERGAWIPRLGINAPLEVENKLAALAEYPPHRHAQFTDRELLILFRFLSTMRRSTVLAVAAGNAEFWCARIPEVRSQVSE